MLVRPLGRLTPCLPLRVDFDVHASDALARLISAAAQRLNLEVACKSLVKVYLRGGALLDTVDHFEKDDEIYIASDGDAWREPSDVRQLLQPPRRLRQHFNLPNPPIRRPPHCPSGRCTPHQSRRSV